MDVLGPYNSMFDMENKHHVQLDMCSNTQELT